MGDPLGLSSPLASSFHLSSLKECSVRSHPVALGHCQDDTSTQEPLTSYGVGLPVSSTPGVPSTTGGAAAHAPSLCDPSDGVSPSLGRKRSLTSPCLWQGSIGDSQEPREWVSGRRRAGPMQRAEEFRRVSPEKRQLSEYPKAAAQDMCRA